MLELTAKGIIKNLEKKGFEALYVGGAVRDELLNIPFNDIDIATNANTDTIVEVFKPISKSVNLVGKNFGVVIVDDIEVAMYRSENYNNSHKPTVNQVGSYFEDSARRDFTINSIAKNSKGDIIDYHGGIDDIENKLIRFVGNPIERIQEDPSRMLRAFYFASRFNFSIEKQSLEAIEMNVKLLEVVPNALKGKIIQKVIAHNCLSHFMMLIAKSGALPFVINELNHTIGKKQNPKYHKYDVFNHIVKVIESSEKRFPSNPIFLLSALLHDCAKGLPHIRGVNKEGQPNDIGHEDESCRIGEIILDRFEVNKSMKKTILFIIKFHGLRLNENPKNKSIMKALRKMKGYFSNKDELRHHVNLLFDFMMCDADGFSDDLKEKIHSLVFNLRGKFMQVIKDYAFYPKDLEVNGQDIQLFGFKGKMIGEIINALIDLNKWKRNDIISFLSNKSKVK